MARATNMDIERLLSKIVERAYAGEQDSGAMPSVEVVAPLLRLGIWGARLMLEDEDGEMSFTLEGSGKNLREALEELLDLVEQEYGD